jgi:hypothetical protein
MKRNPVAGIQPGIIAWGERNLSPERSEEPKYIQEETDGRNDDGVASQIPAS